MGAYKNDQNLLLGIKTSDLIEVLRKRIKQLETELESLKEENKKNK